MKAVESVLAPARRAALRAVTSSGDVQGVVRRLLLVWDIIDKIVRSTCFMRKIRGGLGRKEQWQSACEAECWQCVRL